MENTFTQQSDAIHHLAGLLPELRGRQLYDAVDTADAQGSWTGPGGVVVMEVAGTYVVTST
jgi:hypothetical protein